MGNNFLVLYEKAAGKSWISDLYRESIKIPCMLVLPPPRQVFLATWIASWGLILGQESWSHVIWADRSHSSQHVLECIHTSISPIITTISIIFLHLLGAISAILIQVISITLLISFQWWNWWLYDDDHFPSTMMITFHLQWWLFSIYDDDHFPSTMMITFHIRWSFSIYDDDHFLSR